MNRLLLVFFMGLLPIMSSAQAADTDFNFEKYKGKVLYVDFWASWCTPCRASFPFMQAIAEEHGDALAVVAINVDKDHADAEKFLKQFEINFDIVYDSQGTLAESFDVKGMPTSYLYDSEGKLLGTHVGFKVKDIEKLEAAIAMAVTQQEL